METKAIATGLKAEAIPIIKPEWIADCDSWYLEFKSDGDTFLITSNGVRKIDFSFEEYIGRS